jgi:hypothetical protein
MGSVQGTLGVRRFATDAAQVATVKEALIFFATAARVAERAVFDGIPIDRRDRATGAGWSAKDVLAPIPAGRDRPARRLQAGVDRNQSPSPARMALRFDDATLDIMNARSHAQRARWTWEHVEADAGASFARLIAALRATDELLLKDSGLLVGSILGSGPLHDLEHLSAVPGVRRKAPSRALVAVGREIAEAGVLAEDDAGRLLYNLACREALEGRIASARRMLRSALRVRPDLRAYAAQDADLVRLHGELGALSSQSRRFAGN